MEKSKIIDKIKKCLALAASDNPNESASAMRQAHALMRKYKIDETAITQSEVVMLAVPVAYKRNLPLHVSSLAQACAGAFNCLLVWAPSRYGSSIKFFGGATDVDLATYAFAQLNRALHAATKAYELTLPVYADAMYRRHARKAFCHGWTHAVYASVAEFAKSFKETPEFRLIHDTAAARLKGGLQTREVTATARNAAALAAGSEQGSKVKIRTGVHADKSARLSAC